MASLTDFSNDAVSPQEAVIKWGIAQNELLGATGDGIRIDTMTFTGTSPGIARSEEL